MFDRMHRQRGPRRWIDRIVVNRMDPLIKRRRVDQSVDAKEMDFMNCRHQQRQHTQPDPISLNIQPSKDMVPVRETPQPDNFNCGPDWNTDEKAAKEIIDVLAFKPKDI